MGLKQILTIQKSFLSENVQLIPFGKIKIADHTCFPEMVPMLSFLYLLSLPHPENCNTDILS